MEIRNINNTPNFTGIYQLRKADARMLKDISQHMQGYVVVTHRPVYMFSGKHPMEGAVVSVIQDSVEECKRYSYDWLVKNASNHGLKLPTLDDVDTWVFTGDDVNIVRQFVLQSKKVVDKIDSFWEKLKRVFFANSSDKCDYDLPEHLKQLYPFVQQNNQMIDLYRGLIDGKKVVEVKNVQDLFQSMLRDTK